MSCDPCQVLCFRRALDAEALPGEWLERAHFTGCAVDLADYRLVCARYAGEADAPASEPLVLASLAADAGSLAG